MCALSSSHTSPQIQIPPATDRKRLTSDFEVRIGGRLVPVYRSAGSPYAIFSFSGSVSVEIRRPGTIWEAVLPKQGEVPWSAQDETLRFTLSEARNLVIQGTAGEELFLFANPIETEIPDPENPDVIYFGPGIHHAGVIEVSSGQTVYLAPGAFVHGQIKDSAGTPWAAQGTSGDAIVLPHPKPFVTGIRIRGRGVLLGDSLQRGSGTEQDPYGIMVDLYGANDVLIEGIVIDNPPYWTVVPSMCDGLKVDNLKVIGTRINNDGIQVRNCSNVHIRGGFFRTNDDAVAIKGFNSCNRKSNRKILVEGSVIYNKEGGQALEIGHSTKCAYIEWHLVKSTSRQYLRSKNLRKRVRKTRPQAMIWCEKNNSISDRVFHASFWQPQAQRTRYYCQKTAVFDRWDPGFTAAVH